jgi:hypothetical protein
MDSPVIEFRSGEPKVSLFGGIGFGVMAISVALSGDDLTWLVVILALAAAYQVRRAIRTWNVPAVRLTDDDVQVFVRGRIAHYLPWEKIQSVETGFNSTVLRLKNDVRVCVKSTEFLWGSEVEAFRDAVRKRLTARAAAA